MCIVLQYFRPPAPPGIQILLSWVPYSRALKGCHQCRQCCNHLKAQLERGLLSNSCGRVRLFTGFWPDRGQSQCLAMRSLRYDNLTYKSMQSMRVIRSANITKVTGFCNVIMKVITLYPYHIPLGRIKCIQVYSFLNTSRQESLWIILEFANHSLCAYL